MGTKIEEILSAIEAWTPSPDSDSVSVGVWGIDELKETLSPMSVPKRIISVNPPGVSADYVAHIDLGPTMKIEWSVTDTFYFKPVGEMAALRRHSHDLVKYVASYTEAIRQNRSPSSQSHILEAYCYPDIYAWPEGSDNRFYGVQCSLTIEEFVS